MPQAPPAPWSTRLDAVVWWHRATPAALETLPAALRARRRLPLTLAGFVRYAESPVGPYHELFASPVVLVQWPLPAGTVPFIAVDSPASLAGGRANWALPKTMARFRWPADGVQPAAHAEDWTVTACVRPRGPAVPFAVAASNRQVAADRGELAMAIWARGRARLGRAGVHVAGAGLASWLRPGDHRAIVISGARARFGVPRVARRPRPDL